MVTAFLSRRQPSVTTAGRWQSAGIEAQRRLQDSPYPAHHRLRCSFRAGVLVVQGRVSSYYMRQMVWALVADLEGIDEFVDRVEVVQPV